MAFRGFYDTLGLFPVDDVCISTDLLSPLDALASLPDVFSLPVEVFNTLALLFLVRDVRVFQVTTCVPMVCTVALTFVYIQ
mmetsp:Transcript_21435/g.34674  ORF Transcript_21435/g.34674 Transcript_21435/m.34674 type:complete len:81 (+) Transcript_21435:108-350(+)